MGSARLEYAMAELAMAARGLEGDKQLQKLMKPRKVRDAFRELAAEHADWRPFLRLWQDCEAVLDDRNRLMHAVVVTAADDTEQAHPEFWHVPSDSQVSIGPAAIKEHARDIDRCVRRVMRLIPEAHQRRAAAST